MKPPATLPASTIVAVSAPRLGGILALAKVVTVFFRLLTDYARKEYWTRDNPSPDVSYSYRFNATVSVMNNIAIINGNPDGSFKLDSTKEPPTRTRPFPAQSSYASYRAGFRSHRPDRLRAFRPLR